MKQLTNRIVSLLKDGPAPTHPLAITAIGLAFFMPFIGFVLGFVARTQIAFSGDKYSGDRLALAAIVVAPIAQFSTLIVGFLWLVAMFATSSSF